MEQDLGHYDTKPSGREPPWSTWVSHNRSRLPKIAFAYAEGDDRTKWKLPHHWIDGQGTLWAHKGGVRAAIRMVGHTDISEAAKERCRAHLGRHRSAFERRDDVRDGQVKEVLEMLVDDRADLKLDVIRETIEELQGEVAVATEGCDSVEEECREALGTVASQKVQLEEDRQRLEVARASIAALEAEKKTLVERLEASEQLASDGETELAARKTELVDEILGKMEVCGDDQEKRDRAKESLGRMDFSELDGALSDVMERWREKFVVKPVGDPGDVGAPSVLDGLAVVSLN